MDQNLYKIIHFILVLYKIRSKCYKMCAKSHIFIWWYLSHAQNL